MASASPHSGGDGVANRHRPALHSNSAAVHSSKPSQVCKQKTAPFLDLPMCQFQGPRQRGWAEGDQHFALRIMAASDTSN